MNLPGGHRRDNVDDNDSGSTRLGRHEHPTGTSTGADVTGRMTGTETVRPAGRADHDYENRGVRHAKTSAAAAFALVFGLAALFCGLTAILAPAAILFGIIGIILGIAGMKMAKRPGVTGKGVATGGLVTAILGLLLGAAVIGGLTYFANDEGAVNWLQERVDDLRSNLPSGSEITEELPAG